MQRFGRFSNRPFRVKRFSDHPVRSGDRECLILARHATCRNAAECRRGPRERHCRVYFSCVKIDENVLLSFVRRPLMDVTIAIEIPAASCQIQRPLRRSSFRKALSRRRTATGSTARDYQIVAAISDDCPVNIRAGRFANGSLVTVSRIRKFAMKVAGTPRKMERGCFQDALSLTLSPKTLPVAGLTWWIWWHTGQVTGS